MIYIQKGNITALNELYHRYNHRLLQYFYKMFGGNKEKAQDFLQEIFLRIIEKSTLFNNGKKFSNWIFTIAHNMCKNEYRRQEVRRNTYIQNSNNDVQNPENIIEQKIDHKIIKKVVLNELNQMDVLHRTSFVLKFQENLTIKEISNILECAEGTVKSRLFYTIQKLSNRLKSYNPYKDEV